MKTKILYFFLCTLSFHINLRSEPAKDCTLSEPEKFLNSPYTAKYALQYKKIIEKIFFRVNQSIYRVENCLDPIKLCSIEHLDKTKYLLQEIAIDIENYEQEYVKEHHGIALELAKNFYSEAENQNNFLKGILSDGAHKWQIEYFQLTKATIQLADEIMNFFINTIKTYIKSVNFVIYFIPVFF
ncbi:MAG: hypothetical protein Q8K60_02150 [Parachlamydiaceae bacterium]|nr:hypothetical protein [Parachlamydiaceae bacterium]